MNLVLYFDGGSRQNPGPSGCGAVVCVDGVDENGEVLWEVLWEAWKFLGHATNNEAEYGALIMGLEGLIELVSAETVESVEIRGDSKLVINQVTGAYRTRDHKLIPLCLRARALLESLHLPPEALVHVPRRQNAHADRLANLAMDTRADGVRR
tara:strand:+ start:781 stop:1239 length:459 start_codon:yes stop_codon:yes gene_type:complete